MSLFQGLIGLNSDKLFNKIFNFSFLKKLYCVIALVIIFFSCLFCTINSLNYGIEFSGGLIFNLKKVESVKFANLTADIKNTITEVKEADVSIAPEAEFLVLKIKENSKTQISNIAKEAVASYLLSRNFVIVKSDLIGNVISKNFIRNVVFSIFFALLAVFIYILIVFNLRFAIAGFISLVVNIAFMMLFISFVNIEITLLIITAILSIIGYAINDTIVIFDRIREIVSERFLGSKTGIVTDIKTSKQINFIDQEMSENLIQSSLRKVVARSIITSFVTLVASLGIFFIPSVDIQNFTKVIVVGIFFGAICSLFFATSFILIGRSGLDSFAKKAEKKSFRF